MTITSEFTGTENYAERMAGLEAIHDWWFGAGSFAAAATLGQVRANLNTLLVGTTILNRETFATWLSKVNTLNEPDEYAAALTFGEGQSGALWQCTVPASLRAATDGTGEVAIGGSIARINDSSGNALHLTQASASLRPVRGRRPKTGRRNLLTHTEDFTNGVWAANLVGTSTRTNAEGTQGFGLGMITVTSEGGGLRYSIAPQTLGKDYTLSFFIKSTATSITIMLENGGAAAGRGASVVINPSTGGWDTPDYFVVTSEAFDDGWLYRVTFPNLGGQGRLNYEWRAPNSTIFYIGRPQLEATAEATAYQKASSAYDITETGVEPVSFAAFDLVDDALTTGAIAGGLTGQAFVAGDGGCYVSDLAVTAGGAFSIGGTSRNWTGATPGILRAVTGGTGRVLDAMIREGAFTEDEIVRLERYYRALGGRGLLVPTGDNLIANGGFDANVAGWTVVKCTAVAAAGEALVTLAAGEIAGGIHQAIAVTPGLPHIISGASRVGTGALASIWVYDSAFGGSVGAPYLDNASGSMTTYSGVWVPTVASNSVYLRVTDAGGETGVFDNISVRRLIPREDL